MDPRFISSYEDYYVSVNPWLGFWQSAPAGIVLSSEKSLPSSSFRDSEFYVEWLAPQQNMEAAVGLRLDVDARTMIHAAWHYDLARAPAYEAPAIAVLNGLRTNLADAVRNAGALRAGLDGGLRLGRMIERIDGAAFLVERDRRVREANAEASLLLAGDGVAGMTANVLVLRDARAGRWLEETIGRLVDGEAVDTTSLVFARGDHIYRITLTLAPERPDPGIALLVPPRPLVLVVLKLLVGGAERLDDVSLRAAFGLSPAEVRLCEILVNGHSLAVAARKLGLSDGTVRQRVKLVFHKTGTHRQGELVALLGRFRDAPRPG